MVRINFTIDEKLLTKLDYLAKEGFTTRSGMISKLILDYTSNTHSGETPKDIATSDTHDIHTQPLRKHQIDEDLIEEAGEDILEKTYPCRAPNVMCKLWGYMYKVVVPDMEMGEIETQIPLCNKHVELILKQGGSVIKVEN